MEGSKAPEKVKKVKVKNLNIYKTSCSKCKRELVMKYGRKPKCPYCRNADFLKLGVKKVIDKTPSVVSKSVSTVDKVTVGDLIMDALKEKKK